MGPSNVLGAGLLTPAAMAAAAQPLFGYRCRMTGVELPFGPTDRPCPFTIIAGHFRTGLGRMTQAGGRQASSSAEPSLAEDGQN